MPDIIKLLPETVANQIAAGEVVQRPASVVKELLENSIDAGASDIKLIIKDAGRTLIQVADNGTGMSETDARMCFERHATSKISDAKDLYSLTTMGFRGEALASIASVARVELRTRTAGNHIGTEVIVEGSDVISQHPCQCSEGTSIAVKNLFYNIPARRQFLKGDMIEKSHINNEFIRAALAYPEISFTQYYNNQITLQSIKENLGKRICTLFGSGYKQRLVPVSENSQFVKIDGFILKPEFAKRKRGEQYFFVNRRFVKSSYLNHAIEAGFNKLIPEGLFPSFFIFIEISPDQIDVNVHPTKTEIKFFDERIIYQVLKTSVKRSLGINNILPTLDFESETGFGDLIFDKNKSVIQPTIQINPSFNPFESNQATYAGKNLSQKIKTQEWENETEIVSTQSRSQPPIQISQDLQPAFQDDFLNTNRTDESDWLQQRRFLHLHGRFIISPIKSGIMIIDYQRAHERILFERYIRLLKSEKPASQTLLYPEHLRLSPSDASVMKEIILDVEALGFEINEIKGNTFVISAIPAFITDQDEICQIVESIVDNFRNNRVEDQSEYYIKIAKSIAKGVSRRAKKSLTDGEMNLLADELFSCEIPYYTPSGSPVFTIITHDELSEKFK